MSFNVTEFPKELVISKCEELKNIFENDEFTSDLEINEALIKIDDLRSILKLNKTSSPNDDLFGSINDRDSSSRCNNFDCCKLNDQYEKVKNDNNELRAKIILIENDLSITVKKLTLEKEEYRLRVDALSDDLEQQIDECMELNNKLVKFSEIEKALNSDSLNKTNNIYNSRILDKSQNNHTKISSLAIDHRDNSNNSSDMNMSILDLDAMHIDSLCWPEDQTTFIAHIEPTRDQINSFNAANSSCYNLDYLNSELLIDDSKNMLEELDQLDWEDHGKIDLLLDKSISIFMKSVLKKLDCTKNSRIECQLKKAFSDYKDVLSKKLKRIQHTYEDLNNTCVFEKLERELQVDSEICETKKQLNVLTKENDALISDMKEILKYREDSDNRNLVLQLEIADLNTQINNMYESQKLLQSRYDELTICKDSLETSSQMLKHTIQELKDKNEEIMNTGDNTVNSLKSQLSRLTVEFETALASLTMSRSRIEHLEKHIADMQSDLEISEVEIQRLRTEELETVITRENTECFIISLNAEVKKLISEVKETEKKTCYIKF